MEKFSTSIKELQWRVTASQESSQEEVTSKLKQCVNHFKRNGNEVQFIFSSALEEQCANLIVWRATVRNMHWTRNRRPSSRKRISSLMWWDHLYLTTPIRPPLIPVRPLLHEAVLATAVDGSRGALCVDSMASQGYISFLPIRKEKGNETIPSLRLIKNCSDPIQGVLEECRNNK